jgi:hypothetical protein
MITHITYTIITHEKLSITAEQQIPSSQKLMHLMMAG